MRRRRVKYAITEGARDDLLAIRAYLKLQGEDAWPTVRRALQEAFHTLAKFPFSGRVHLEWTDARYRFLPVYAYEVMYRVDSDGVKIIRVIHGARDVGRALSGRL